MSHNQLFDKYLERYGVQSFSQLPHLEEMAPILGFEVSDSVLSCMLFDTPRYEALISKTKPKAFKNHHSSFFSVFTSLTYNPMNKNPHVMHDGVLVGRCEFRGIPLTEAAITQKVNERITNPLAVADVVHIMDDLVSFGLIERADNGMFYDTSLCFTLVKRQYEIGHEDEQTQKQISGFKRLLIKA